MRTKVTPFDSVSWVRLLASILLQVRHASAHSSMLPIVPETRRDSETLLKDRAC